MCLRLCTQKKSQMTGLEASFRSLTLLVFTNGFSLSIQTVLREKIILPAERTILCVCNKRNYLIECSQVFLSRNII